MRIFFFLSIKDEPVWKNFISSWQLIVSEYWLMNDELRKIIPDVLWIEINKSCNKNLANVCCGFCGWEGTASTIALYFVKTRGFFFFLKINGFQKCEVKMKQKKCKTVNCKLWLVEWFQNCNDSTISKLSLFCPWV